MAKRKVLTIKKDAPVTWEESLQEFLFWKQAHGVSERTIQDYKTHVNILFNRFPNAFNPKKLKAAILKHMAQPVKPATFNLRLVYLRAFFDWCINEGFLTDNPLADFKRKKAEAGS